MAKLAKRVKAIRENVAGKRLVPLEEAVDLVKKNASAKFDETVEVAMNLGVNPRHADQMVRGSVNLPNGTGKTVRVAVFARGPKAEEAEKAGADVVGAEDLMEQVQGGKIDFDRCIATPDMMPIVGRLGKILGPRGLMPNPKVGTVTMDVAQAVQDAKGGQVQFRVEKAGIVHAGIGKASFDEGKLVENARALVDAVNRAKPTGAKGTYLDGRMQLSGGARYSYFRDAIRADENLQLLEQEGLNLGYLAYNTQMAPFDNPKVRKALIMAINKQVVIDAVFQGSGKIAKNPIAVGD